MPVAIPVSKLKKHCDPFRCCPWESSKVTRKCVLRALKEDRLVPISYHETTDQENFDHAGRIAFLVLNPSKDPIQIDVGIPDMGCHINWMIQDGNHRMAAAIYRKDIVIFSEVAGSLDYAEEIFGMDCEEK